MSATTPAGPISPTSSDGLVSPPIANNRLSGAPKEVHDTLAMLDDMAKGDDAGKGNESGIAFDASSTLKTDESDATRSDSYPVSPIGPSEKAESTRASSISESTDETIQEANSKQTPIIEEEAADEDVPGFQPRQEPEHISPSKEAHVAIPEPTQELLPQLLPVTYKPAARPTQVTEVETSVAEVPEAGEEQFPTVALAKAAEINPVLQEIENAAAIPDTAAPEPQKHSTEQSKQAPVVEAANPITPEETPQPVSHIKPEVKEWKVPRSKFSIQDLKAAAGTPEIPNEPLPRPVTSTNVEAAQKSPVGSTFSLDTKGDGQQSSQKNRRRGLVEPIRTDIELTDRSAANSDANFSSDEDLMDELQSAVVQEAMPISVSKSPISPVFPSPKKPNTERTRFPRAASNPMKKEKSDAQLLGLPDSPQPETSRSVSASAAYLNQISQQAAKPMAVKVNLGSGISQRIKALEKLSSNGPGANSTPGTTGPTPGASPAFFSVRKASVRGASRSPSIAERASSLNRKTPSPSVSHESSPETFKIRERSGSIQSRVEAFKTSPIPTVQQQRGRPESISVTARIIRDPDHPFPSKSEAGKDPLDYTPLDLKQSPLVIDHQRAVAEPPKETILERRLSKERPSESTAATTRERRSSITVIKDLINEGRTSFSERRRSIGIDRSASSPPVRSPSRSRPPSTHARSPSHQRPMSISSRLSVSSRDLASTTSPPPTAGSSSSTSEEKSEKKSSRASRMIRRLSSSLSSSRKTLTHPMSPTVREESEPPIGHDSRSLASSHLSMTPNTPSVNIGDVNVQFPDTLLWKRRSMVLDSQGFLILSPALTASGNGKDKANNGATRRFHFSEFRVPVIPDVEMQELPNSVVLDFVEGSGLQVACEDRAGQARVLQGMFFFLTSSPGINILPFANYSSNNSSTRCTSHLGSLRPITPLRTHHSLPYNVYSDRFMLICSCTLSAKPFDAVYDAWRPCTCIFQGKAQIPDLRSICSCHLILH